MWGASWIHVACPPQTFPGLLSEHLKLCPKPQEKAYIELLMPRRMAIGFKD